MDMEDRIVYDGNELIQILEGYLDRLKPFRFDHRFRELLGEPLIQKINTWDSNIRKQKDSPLTLVVCGEFKRGKSSLINAILGEDVVTTDITTETITTNKISYGPHKNEIVLSGGKRIVLNDDELKSEKLRVIMEGLPEAAARLELKRPLEILKQVTIVDTPGLQDSAKDFSADVEQALSQADAVIYLFSVMYPLSVNEQLFIRTVIKPQKYTELFLVGNMADMLEDTAACKRVQDMLNSRLETVLPGETPIMLSALDERCRQMGARRPNRELAAHMAENFDNFRQQLMELLYSKQNCIYPDRIHRLLSGMTQDIRHDLEALMQGLDMNMDQISAEMDNLRSYKEHKIEEQAEIADRIDSQIEQAHGQSIEWISELLEKMEADIGNLKEVEVEDIKKFYVLFCVDTIQEALQRCLDESLMELYDMLDDISEDVSRKMSLKSKTPAVCLSFSLQNKTWTKGDNVAFLSSAVGLKNSLLGLAVDYIAGGMRQKKLNESTDNLIQEIKSQYDGLRISVFRILKDAYKNMSAGAKEQICAYFEDQVQALENQVACSTTAARQNDEKKREIRLVVNELQMLLDEIEENCC